MWVEIKTPIITIFKMIWVVVQKNLLFENIFLLTISGKQTNYTPPQKIFTSKIINNLKKLFFLNIKTILKKVQRFLVQKVKEVSRKLAKIVKLSTPTFLNSKIVNLLNLFHQFFSFSFAVTQAVGFVPQIINNVDKECGQKLKPLISPFSK